MADDIEDLLSELLTDAYGDDEALTALETGIAEALTSPTPANVVGTPVSLVAVEYSGDPRRGLVAVVRRDDGAKHRVSLVDVAVSEEAEVYAPLEAFRRWLRVPSPVFPREARTSPSKKSKSSESSKARGRATKAPSDDTDDFEIDVTKPVESLRSPV